MSVFDEIEEIERQERSKAELAENIQEVLSAIDDIKTVNENLQKFVDVCQRLKRQLDKASINGLEKWNTVLLKLERLENKVEKVNN